MLFLLGIKYLLISLTVASSAFQVFQSKDVPEKSTTPEEFIRMTKGITVATAKAVAAGNSAQQEDVISTANLSRKAISDMLTTCKVLIHHHTDICPLTQTQSHRMLINCKVEIHKLLNTIKVCLYTLSMCNECSLLYFSMSFGTNLLLTPKLRPLVSS